MPGNYDFSLEREVKTDFLSIQGVDLGEQKLSIAEHLQFWLQTRFSLNQQQSIQSVTVFSDFNFQVGCCPSAS